MLKITSPIDMLLRRDFPLADATGTVVSDVYASGYAGSWVTLDANGYAKLNTSSTGPAFMVWNESNRDGSQGWSPDIKKSKKITTLVGKGLFVTTDRVKGTPAVGAALIGDPSNPGFLKVSVAAAGENILGYVLKASYSLVHMGTTYATVWDIVTD